MTKPIRMTLLALILAVAACGDSGAVPDPDGPVIVTWETPDGETFRTVVSGETAVSRVRTALEADGRAGIPNGRLVAGDGGVNSPHQWHLTDVELVDMTIELCDGTVTLVNADLDYWLDSVGRFCPWDAKVVAVEAAG